MIERGEGWEMHLGDSLDVLPTLGHFDALVTDPPYGIGEARGKNASRGRLAKATDFGVDAWDDVPPSPEHLALCISKADAAILFGGNYFDLPPSSCWLVWDKLNGASDFADCELAWTNLRGAVRRLQHRWAGMLREGREYKVGHPTQKPVAVMVWALSMVPSAKTVLDPFAGSATTGVACLRTGRAFVGIERERKYFDLACARLRAEQAESSLEAARAGQRPLFGGET